MVEVGEETSGEKTSIVEQEEKDVVFLVIEGELLLPQF